MADQAVGWLPVTNLAGLSCDQLETSLARAQHFLQTATDPETRALLEMEIATLEREIAQKGCGVPIVINSTLTGTAMLETDHSGSEGPFDENVSMALSFSGNNVTLQPFNFSFPNDVTVTSNGGTGTFNRATGSINIPANIVIKTDSGTLNLNFNLTTDHGDAHGDFVAQGIRLTADGTVLLAGTAFESFLVGGVNVLLMIFGVVAPHP